jgi:hypothetical protein
MNEQPNWQAPPQPNQVNLTRDKGYQGGNLPAILELAKGMIRSPNQVVDTGSAYRPANRQNRGATCITIRFAGCACRK